MSARAPALSVSVEISARRRGSASRVLGACRSNSLALHAPCKEANPSLKDGATFRKYYGVRFRARWWHISASV